MSLHIYAPVSSGLPAWEWLHARCGTTRSGAWGVEACLCVCGDGGGGRGGGWRWVGVWGGGSGEKVSSAAKQAVCSLLTEPAGSRLSPSLPLSFPAAHPARAAVRARGGPRGGACPRLPHHSRRGGGGHGGCQPAQLLPVRRGPRFPSPRLLPGAHRPCVLAPVNHVPVSGQNHKELIHITTNIMRTLLTGCFVLHLTPAS